MPRISLFKKWSEAECVRPYVLLRNLLKSGQIIQAQRLFTDEDWSGMWQNLLHYAMLRRNCQVSVLIIKSAIRIERLTEYELVEIISKIDHDVSKDFAQRIRDSIQTGRFEEEFVKYSKVRTTVSKQVASRIGRGLLNPNEFGKSSA